MVQYHNTAGLNFLYKKRYNAVHCINPLKCKICGSGWIKQKNIVNDPIFHSIKSIEFEMICLFSFLTVSVTGYIIYYSTDVNAEVHDWVIEPVVGNRLTHQIQELTLDTTYYFKIQARNSKGMGPMSEAVQFRTPKSMFQ